jgi:hypothetical protein
MVVGRCNWQWKDVIYSGKRHFAVERCNWQWKDVIGSGKMYFAE